MLYPTKQTSKKSSKARKATSSRKRIVKDALEPICLDRGRQMCVCSFVSQECLTASGHMPFCDDMPWVCERKTQKGRSWRPILDPLTVIRG